MATRQGDDQDGTEAPSRSIDVDPDLYEEAEAKARARGENLDEVVARGLAEYLKRGPSGG